MSRRPRLRGVRAALIGALGVLVVAALVFWVVLGPGPRARNGTATDVILDPGEGVSAVGAALDRAGVIGSPLAFIVVAEATGSARRLKAGEYVFDSGATLREILHALVNGIVVRRRITIPEGLTSRDAADVLRRADYLTGPLRTPREGSLLPETYDVRRGESRQAVLYRMIVARDRLLERLWAARAPGLPFASPEQAVTLASVVEKETAKVEERPHIAAVFINRLKKGMRLESDPTVIYAVSGGEPLGHGLRVSELALRSPYNTYLFGGLPPTPIANPGAASIAAALNPLRSDDLYFVADGSGGHVFADTFEAHKRNVARWRRIEQARQGGAGS